METRRRSTRQMGMRSSTFGISKPAARATTTHPILGTVRGTTSKAKRSTKPAGKKARGFVDLHYAESAPDPNATTILLRQPREIFLLIAGHLPIESLVCLSLTCKGVLQIVGRACWESPDIRKRSLRYHNEPRHNLMQCLARDAGPHLTFCDICTTMHPPLLAPNSHCQTRSTTKCMGQWGHIDYFPQVKNDVESPGYSLVYPHVESVFVNPSSLDSLVGTFTADTTGFTYRLASGAAWVKGNLVLQHMHYFTPKFGSSPLRPEDIVNLPLQICPHQSTTTATPTRSAHTANRTANGPLLTHAIATAFPPGQSLGILRSINTLRTPTPLEMKQISNARMQEDFIWNCRGCTTKFRAELENGSLLITTWHCFGSDLFHAVKYWKWLVRREAHNLGPGKRNSEFWYPSRTVPDFPIQGERVFKTEMFGRLRSSSRDIMQPHPL